MIVCPQIRLLRVHTVCIVVSTQRQCVVLFCFNVHTVYALMQLTLIERCPESTESSPVPHEALYEKNLRSLLKVSFIYEVYMIFVISSDKFLNKKLRNLHFPLY